MSHERVQINYQRVVRTRESSYPPLFDIIEAVPEKQIHQVPIVIGPGFATGAGQFELPMGELALEGFRVICPNYLYGLRGEHRRWGVLPESDRARRETLFALIQEKGQPNKDGVKQVDVLVHSKGAYDIALLAKEHPGIIRNIVMYAPGNLRPEMGVLEAMKTLKASERLNKLQKAQLAAERGGDVAKRIQEGSEYAADYARHPLRYFLDAFTSATGSIRTIIPELKQQGIKIIIVAQRDDAFWGPSTFEFLKEDVFRVEVVDGIHGELRYVPFGGRHAGARFTELEAAA